MKLLGVVIGLGAVIACGTYMGNKTPEDTKPETIYYMDASAATPPPQAAAQPTQAAPPPTAGWGTEPLPDKPFAGFPPVKRDGQLLLTKYQPLQIRNASIIVRIGEQMGLPERAWIIAIATASQECKIYNCVNSNTAKYPAVVEATKGLGDGDTKSSDNDSCGFFQERLTHHAKNHKISYRESARLLMNKEYAAELFYNRLLGKIQERGWQTTWQDIDITVVAQAVQVSSYPDHYAAWEEAATALVRYVRQYKPE